MFCAGHVLSSLAFSVAIARRRPVNFVIMAALAMSANVFDLDHVFYHHLDDGTGNSLRLHPAHVYFGLIGLALFLGALVDRRRFDYWVGVLAVLCLHLSMDVVSMLVRYDMAVLAAVDAAMVLLIPLLAWRWPVGVAPLRLGLFALAAAVACDAAQGFLQFGLGLRLDRDVAVVLVPAAMSALSGPVFWLIFRRKRLAGRSACGERSRTRLW
jgi:hypothetical protein